MGSGIIRRVDDLGRIVLPKDIRRQLRIFEGDPLEFEIVDNSITLRKYHPADTILSEIKALDMRIEDNSDLNKEESQQLRKHIAEMLHILDQD